MEAREALEILQMYPVTFSFFLPRIYISAVKEDLKSFHFPKLSSCITSGEPMNKEAMRKWKEGTGINLRNVYGQTEMVSHEYAGLQEYNHVVYVKIDFCFQAHEQNNIGVNSSN